MVQVRKMTTYGFLPWHLIYACQEIEALAREDSSSAAGALLQDEQGPTTLSPDQEGAGQAAEVPSAEPTIRPMPHPLTQVKFRQALIEVDDPGDFWSGVVGGQVAMLEEPGPFTAAQIFELFEDGVRDVEFSETWLAGYLLGLGDALLRQRKLYPRAYIAQLKSPNSRKSE
jgi:hypothetical protein